MSFQRPSAIDQDANAYRKTDSRPVNMTFDRPMHQLMTLVARHTCDKDQLWILGRRTKWWGIGGLDVQ